MTNASILEKLDSLETLMTRKMDGIRDAEIMTDAEILLDRVHHAYCIRFGNESGEGHDGEMQEWGYITQTLEGLAAILEDETI